MEDYNEDGHMLLWVDHRDESDPEHAYYYAIYRFADGERIDHSNPRHLVSVSTKPYYIRPLAPPGKKYIYLVTAINRFWQESKPTKITIRY